MAVVHCRAVALTLVLALAAALAGTDRAAAQNWLVYAPAGAGYSIEMPGQPTVSVEDVPTDAGTVKQTQATVEAGGAAYLATYLDIAPALLTQRSTDEHLDSARDGQAEGGRLVSEERIVVSGNQARHVVIEKQGFHLVVRTVLVGNRLFQFAYVGKPGTEEEPGPKRFHGSLKIVPR